MSQQICIKCKKPFKQGEDVIAQVITKFVALRSQIHYALEKPSDCLEIQHLDCDPPCLEER